MQILHSMDEFRGTGSVAALGTFDGMHLGHRKLIETAVSLARQAHVPALALTFDRHPLSLIRPEAVPAPLLSRAGRAEILSSLGLDVLVEQPFTVEFAAQEPEEYLDRIVRALHPAAIVAGFNHRFGRGGRGDADLITTLAERLGYRPVIISPVTADGEVVSSTRIRELLAAGDAAGAERLMERKPDIR